MNGHPDPNGKGLCHGLAEAYADGARRSGHSVERIDVAALDFGILHSQAEFEKGKVPAAIAEAQARIHTADHLVVIFPLWLGDLPAVLKAFFEQTLRPGFAFTNRASGFPQSSISEAGRHASSSRWACRRSYFAGISVRMASRT